MSGKCVGVVEMVKKLKIIISTSQSHLLCNHKVYIFDTKLSCFFFANSYISNTTQTQIGNN